jgi:hypothetical protein
LQYYGNYNLSWFRPDLCTSQMDALNDTDLATFFGLDLGDKQKFDGERSMYNLHVIPDLGRVVEHQILLPRMFRKIPRTSGYLLVDHRLSEECPAILIG